MLPVYLYLRRRRIRAQHAIIVTLLLLLLIQVVVKVCRQENNLRVKRESTPAKTCVALFLVLHFRVPNEIFISNSSRMDIKNRLADYTNTSRNYFFMDDKITHNGLPQSMQSQSFYIRGSAESNGECGYVWGFDSQNREVLYDTCQEKSLNNSWKFCKLHHDVVKQLTLTNFANIDQHCRPNLAAAWPLGDITLCTSEDSGDVSKWLESARLLDDDLMKDRISKIIGHEINAWQVLGLVVEYDEGLIQAGFELIKTTGALVVQTTKTTDQGKTVHDTVTSNNNNRLNPTPTTTPDTSSTLERPSHHHIPTSDYVTVGITGTEVKLVTSESTSEETSTYNQEYYMEMVRRIYPEFFSDNSEISDPSATMSHTNPMDFHNLKGSTSGVATEDATSELLTSNSVKDVTTSTNDAMRDLFSLRELLYKIYGILVNNFPQPLNSLLSDMHNATDHTHVTLPEVYRNGDNVESSISAPNMYLTGSTVGVTENPRSRAATSEEYNMETISAVTPINTELTSSDDTFNPENEIYSGDGPDSHSQTTISGQEAISSISTPSRDESLPDQTDRQVSQPVTITDDGMLTSYNTGTTKVLSTSDQYDVQTVSADYGSGEIYEFDEPVNRILPGDSSSTPFDVEILNMRFDTTENHNSNDEGATITYSSTFGDVEFGEEPTDQDIVLEKTDDVVSTASFSTRQTSTSFTLSFQDQSKDFRTDRTHSQVPQASIPEIDASTTLSPLDIRSDPAILQSDKSSMTQESRSTIFPSSSSKTISSLRSDNTVASTSEYDSISATKPTEYPKLGTDAGITLASESMPGEEKDGILSHTTHISFSTLTDTQLHTTGLSDTISSSVHVEITQGSSGYVTDDKSTSSDVENVTFKMTENTSLYESSSDIDTRQDITDKSDASSMSVSTDSVTQFSPGIVTGVQISTSQDVTSLTNAVTTENTSKRPFPDMKDFTATRQEVTSVFTTLPSTAPKRNLTTTTPESTIKSFTKESFHPKHATTSTPIVIHEITLPDDDTKTTVQITTRPDSNVDFLSTTDSLEDVITEGEISDNIKRVMQTSTDLAYQDESTTTVQTSTPAEDHDAYDSTALIFSTMATESFADGSTAMADSIESEFTTNAEKGSSTTSTVGMGSGMWTTNPDPHTNFSSAVTFSNGVAANAITTDHNVDSSVATQSSKPNSEEAYTKLPHPDISGIVSSTRHAIPVTVTLSPLSDIPTPEISRATTNSNTQDAISAVDYSVTIQESGDFAITYSSTVSGHEETTENLFATDISSATESLTSNLQQGVTELLPSISTRVHANTLTTNSDESGEGTYLRSSSVGSDLVQSGAETTTPYTDWKSNSFTSTSNINQQDIISATTRHNNIAHTSAIIEFSGDVGSTDFYGSGSTVGNAKSEITTTKQEDVPSTYVITSAERESLMPTAFQYWSTTYNGVQNDGTLQPSPTEATLSGQTLSTQTQMSDTDVERQSVVPTAIQYRGTADSSVQSDETLQPMPTQTTPIRHTLPSQTLTSGGGVAHSTLSGMDPDTGYNPTHTGTLVHATGTEKEQSNPQTIAGTSGYLVVTDPVWSGKGVDNPSWNSSTFPDETKTVVSSVTSEYTSIPTVPSHSAVEHESGSASNIPSTISVVSTGYESHPAAATTLQNAFAGSGSALTESNISKSVSTARDTTLYVSSTSITKQKAHTTPINSAIQQSSAVWTSVSTVPLSQRSTTPETDETSADSLDLAITATEPDNVSVGSSIHSTYESMHPTSAIATSTFDLMTNTGIVDEILTVSSTLKTIQSNTVKEEAVTVETARHSTSDYIRQTFTETSGVHAPVHSTNTGANGEIETIASTHQPKLPYTITKEAITVNILVHSTTESLYQISTSAPGLPTTSDSSTNIKSLTTSPFTLSTSVPFIDRHHPTTKEDGLVLSPTIAATDSTGTTRMKHYSSVHTPIVSTNQDVSSTIGTTSGILSTSTTAQGAESIPSDKSGDAGITTTDLIGVFSTSIPSSIHELTNTIESTREMLHTVDHFTTPEVSSNLVTKETTSLYSTTKTGPHTSDTTWYISNDSPSSGVTTEQGYIASTTPDRATTSILTTPVQSTPNVKETSTSTDNKVLTPSTTLFHDILPTSTMKSFAPNDHILTTSRIPDANSLFTSILPPTATKLTTSGNVDPAVSATDVVSAVVGKMFQHTIPEFLSSELKHGMHHVNLDLTATTTVHNIPAPLLTDQWLMYCKESKSLCGVPVANHSGDVSQTQTYHIYITTGNMRTSKILTLHVSVYPLPSSKSQDYTVSTAIDIKAISSITEDDVYSLYPVTFIRKLSSYLSSFHSAITNSSINIHNFDFITRRRRRRSTTYSVDVRWSIDEMDLIAFNNTIRHLIFKNRTSDTNFEFFLSMLPEIIVSSNNVTIAPELGFKVKLDQEIPAPLSQGKSAAIGQVLAPILIGLVGLVSFLSLVIIRCRRRPTFFFTSQYTDKTYDKRKPLFLDDEVEMDYFRPSKANLVQHESQLHVSSVPTKLKISKRIGECSDPESNTISDEEDGYYSFKDFSLVLNKVS